MASECLLEPSNQHGLYLVVALTVINLKMCPENGGETPGCCYRNHKVCFLFIVNKLLQSAT